MSDRVESSDAGLGGESGVTEPERMGAIVRLRDRYASDELSLDEFSRALDGALSARTAQELSEASPSRELVAPASRVSWREAEALQQHLVPGEEILWVGRPEGKFPMAPGAAKTLWFIAGLTLFWEAWSTLGFPGVPLLFFPLLGVLFGGAAAYRFVGQYVRLARRTVYALTTRRIVRIIWRSSGEAMDSKLLRMLPRITVSQGKNGRGTVAFGGPAPRPLIGPMDDISSLTETPPLSLINIPDATSVARLIGSLQAYRQE